jgi:hypothetical protein
LNHSITDLQQFDCSTLPGRQQLWAALAEGWNLPPDLTDWIVRRLADDAAARQRLKQRLADLESNE